MIASVPSVTACLKTVVSLLVVRIVAVTITIWFAAISRRLVPVTIVLVALICTLDLGTLKIEAISERNVSLISANRVALTPENASETVCVKI